MKVIVGTGLITAGAGLIVVIFVYAKLGQADSFMSFLRTPGTPLEAYQRSGAKLRRAFWPLGVILVIAGILILTLVK